jgi:hypothetical protein
MADEKIVKAQESEKKLDWSLMTVHLNRKDNTPKHLRHKPGLCPQVAARVLPALVVPSEA